MCIWYIMSWSSRFSSILESQFESLGFRFTIRFIVWNNDKSIIQMDICDIFMD